MTIVPERGAPLFAATLNVTTPMPEAPGPDVIVIHGAVLTAVHPQPAAAVTPIGAAGPLAELRFCDGLPSV